MDELTTENNGSDVKTVDDNLSMAPTRQPIDNSTRELIDKLLLERVS